MTVVEAITELTTDGDVRFRRALHIATLFFGEPRIKGAHHIFKTPWQGDPRLNLQKAGNNAKRYQVEQLIAALSRLRDSLPSRKA